MKCPICGNELWLTKKEVGKTASGEPIYNEFAVCRDCRKKWNLNKKKAKPQEAPVYSNIPPQGVRTEREKEVKKNYETMLSHGVEDELLVKKTKKRVVTVLIIVFVLLLLCALGLWKFGDKILPGKSQKTTSAPGDNKTESDDGIIDFTKDTFSVKYVSHEMGADFDGKPCLFIYYEFTNNGKENLVPMAVLAIQVIQNGKECETAVIMEGKEEITNFMQEVEPGQAVKVCQAVQVGDMSDAEVKVSELISVDHTSDQQIIKLQ